MPMVQSPRTPHYLRPQGERLSATRGMGFVSDVHRFYELLPRCEDYFACALAIRRLGQ
jgi:hypothetical protein